MKNILLYSFLTSFLFLINNAYSMEQEQLQHEKQHKIRKKEQEWQNEYKIWRNDNDCPKHVQDYTLMQKIFYSRWICNCEKQKEELEDLGYQIKKLEEELKTMQ